MTTGRSVARGEGDGQEGGEGNIFQEYEIYLTYMPTTVRVDEETKRELDQLQGLVQAETGRRISHSDLLRRLLDVARRHERELLGAGAAWRPPSAEHLRRLRTRLRDWGVETDARRVDEALYGGSPDA